MKLPSASRALRVVLVSISSLLALSARADLLTPADAAQLSAWLGEGTLSFTKIYTKASGDTSTTFHAAVDGQGPTFALMTISGRAAGSGTEGTSDISLQLIGGYDPLSWNSGGNYNYGLTDAERTSFIFNLTSGTLQRQNLSADGFSGIYGADNDPDLGPTFGNGNDIYVSHNLGWGYAAGYSYGGTAGTGIVSGPTNFSFGADYYRFDVNQLEVYTFSVAGGKAVPDAVGTLGLLVVSLAGLFGLRRRLA